MGPIQSQESLNVEEGDRKDNVRDAKWERLKWQLPTLKMWERDAKSQEKGKLPGEVGKRKE